MDQKLTVKKIMNKELNENHKIAAEFYKKHLKVQSKQICIAEKQITVGTDYFLFLKEDFNPEIFKSMIDQRYALYNEFYDSYESNIQLIPKIPEGEEYIPFFFDSFQNDKIEISNDNYTLILIYSDNNGKNKTKKIIVALNDLIKNCNMTVVTVEKVWENQNSLGDIENVINYIKNENGFGNPVEIAYNIDRYGNNTVGVFLVNKKKQVIYNRPYTEQTVKELETILNTGNVAEEPNNHWRLMFPHIYPDSLYSDKPNFHGDKDEGIDHEKIYVYELDNDMNSIFVCSYENNMTEGHHNH